MISSYEKCLTCGGKKIILSFHQRKKKSINKKGIKYKDLGFIDGKNQLKITRVVIAAPGKSYQDRVLKPPKLCACFGYCNKLRPASSGFSKETFLKIPNYLLNICLNSFSK